MFKNLVKNGTVLTIAYMLIMIVNHISAQSDPSSELPPPPQKPERFTSKQQLKEYLVKLHEYYAIIGRPRFGRSYNMQQEDASSSSSSSSNMKTRVNNLNTNNDNKYVEQSEISNENMAYFMPNALRSNSISFIFELLDLDKDGLITKSEFLKFFKHLSEQN